MATDVQGLINTGTVAELERKGYTVVTGGGHTIAVFAYDDKVYALDNRCPHMGFPLSQGTVRDGILTCHWHHARFDLASGDTFDLFAGDIRRFPVQVVDGQVWVDPSPSAEDRMEYWKQRLVDGLEHNIRLVIARSVIGMMQAGADYREPLETGALFGARYSADGWSAAMSILTACANMLPQLRPEDRPLAIYHGLFHIAEECAGRPPRFLIGPLSVQNPEPARLKEWFRRFVEVRDQEAAERTLRTAIDAGLPPEAVADMVFAAITDHLFADGGHTIDFANKAFELLDHIGWQHAGMVQELGPPDDERQPLRGIVRVASSHRHVQPVVRGMRGAAYALDPGTAGRGALATRRGVGGDGAPGRPGRNCRGAEGGGGRWRDIRRAGRRRDPCRLPTVDPVPPLQRVRRLEHRPSLRDHGQRGAPGPAPGAVGGAPTRRLRFRHQHLPRPFPQRPRCPGPSAQRPTATPPMDMPTKRCWRSCLAGWISNSR